jgi:phosphatidylglycerol---prolipoprotein diacylglyceryl transferase
MHPIVISIFGQPLYAYGMALGLSFISAWYLGMYFANREGLPYKTTVTAYTVAILFALIGARVAHLITNPDSWRFEQGFIVALFASKCEGLVAYGGYIGGTLAVLVYLKMKKEDFWSLADCTTPSMVLGLGITRLGCFFAGCCHGQPTDLPWGVVFPPGSPASHAFPAGSGAAVSSLAVHPTQLYESMVGFLLVPVALFLLKRRKFTGQTFLLLIPMYAIARFFLEFIRGDGDRGTVVGTISTSQFIGIVLVPLAIGLYLWRRNMAPAPPAPLSKEEVEKRLMAAGVLKKKGKKNKRQKPA